jgi:hypothetical protein
MEVEIELVQSARQLAPLTVTAKHTFRSGKMEEFDRRERTSVGHFLSRERLVPLEETLLSQVLRNWGHLQMIPLPSACHSGLAAASGRITDVEIPATMQCSSDPSAPQIQRACYLDVYLDGSRVWHWNEGPPIDIDSYRVRDLQGIELYRGMSEIPAEFQANQPACGILMLWSRTGES